MMQYQSYVFVLSSTFLLVFLIYKKEEIQMNSA